MRTLLVSWIADVSSDFSFKTGTFHMAVNFVDRFQSLTKDIKREQLQLIGLTALAIATKMEVNNFL